MQEFKIHTGQYMSRLLFLQDDVSISFKTVLLQSKRKSATDIPYDDARNQCNDAQTLPITRS